MYDAALAVRRGRARALDASWQRLGVPPRGYALATLHRPYNIDDPERLSEVLAALQALEMPVVFPVHPRTRARRLAGQLNAGRQLRTRSTRSATSTCWRSSKTRR